jgi:hypothetical protein
MPCDQAIDYILDRRLEKEIEKRFARVTGDLDAMRKRKAVLETEIRNLVKSLPAARKTYPRSAPLLLRGKRNSPASPLRRSARAGVPFTNRS